MILRIHVLLSHMWYGILYGTVAMLRYGAVHTEYSRLRYVVYARGAV